MKNIKKTTSKIKAEKSMIPYGFVCCACVSEREREREYQVEDMAGINMEQKIAIGVFRWRV
jgi:hypothetical protein